MDIIKFEEAVRISFKELSRSEIDALFRHFDRRGVGTITLDEFNGGLNSQVALDDRLRFNLHDFISPLQTITKLKKIAPGTVFDLFAKGSQYINISAFK